MARITVVVPIYDVEAYLEDCLRSVAEQSFEDLEVVMVDDGSTDSSAAIAERFERQDGRFRLVRQPNGGLGHARNTGVREGAGDYLAFLDSDDVLPPDAYERLLSSLEATGSDFATGNVQRLTAAGLAQAPFLAKAFARTRRRTHVRRFQPLLSDRTAWNKLWRRSFWDRHSLRFPEGRLHEDIPLVLPAHFRASRVDVIAAPVYHYRVRESGAPSITQRRGELRALEDRFAAVEEVRAYLARHESAAQRRRYDRSAVAGDLRYHLDLLEEADDEYRAVFMRRANAFLDGADRRVCDGLAAIDRVKWQLVRRNRLPELLELLRFAREDALRTPPLRRRGRYYGAYAPCADPGLAVPRSAARLGRRDQELALTATLEDVRFERGKLRLTGHAYVNALGAPRPDRQRLTLAAVRRGGARSLRMRTAALVIPTAPMRRADLDPDLSWAGFRASLDIGNLRDGGSWTDQEWELFAAVRSGRLRRRRAKFAIADAQLVGTLDLPPVDGALATASVTHDGKATIRISTRWLRIERHRLLPGGILELSGSARLADGVEAVLELRRASDGVARRFPIALEGDEFRVRVPLAGLPPEGRLDCDAEWSLRAAAGATLPPLVLAGSAAGAAWRSGGRDMSLERTAAGGARLLARELGASPGLGWGTRTLDQLTA